MTRRQSIPSLEEEIATTQFNSMTRWTLTRRWRNSMLQLYSIPQLDELDSQTR